MNRYDELCHHGTRGMKWGTRKYQNPDGSLTPLGRKRYGTSENFNRVLAAKAKARTDKEVAKINAKTVKKLKKINGEKTPEEIKAEYKKLKKKKISEMTDEELIAKTNRLRLENALKAEMPKQEETMASKLRKNLADAGIEVAKNVGKKYLEGFANKVLGIKPDEIEVLKKEVDKWSNKQKISDAKKKIIENDDWALKRAQKKLDEANAKLETEKDKLKQEAQKQVDEYNARDRAMYNKVGSYIPKDNISSTKETSTMNNNKPNNNILALSGPTSSTVESGKSFCTSIATVNIDHSSMASNKETGERYITELLDKDGNVIHGITENNDSYI